MYGHTYSKSEDQPGEVANSASGQLNRENKYFPVRVVCAREFGLARRIRQSRPPSACSFSYSGWIWCLLTGFLPSSAAASIFYVKTAIRYRVSSEFIGSCTCVPMAFTACRVSAGTRPARLKVVSNECCLGRSPWTNKYASLFPTPTIGMKWAC